MKTSAKIAIAAAIALAGTAIAGTAWAHREGHGYGGGYGMHGGGKHGGGHHGMMHGGGKHGGWHGGGNGRGHGMRHRARHMMERYDANKDGKLTQDEINSNREAWLKEFDVNNDGKLSLDEFKQLYLKARAERIVREFQQFDRDGDAGVTLEEYQRPLADLVERMDRNNDGAISKDDMRGHRKMNRRMMDGGMMGGGMMMDGQTEDAGEPAEEGTGSSNN